MLIVLRLIEAVMASTPNMALGLAADTMPADVTPRANRFGLKVDGFSVWLRSATELGARVGKSSEYGRSVCPAASSVLGRVKNRGWMS